MSKKVKLSLEDVKKSLSELADNILEVPDKIAIHKNYLNRLNNTEFVTAFITYRQIIVDYYREASEKPIEYGYSNISRKTGDEVLQNLFACKMNHMAREAMVTNFLLRLLKVSVINESVLAVDVEKLIAEINTNGKIHKPDIIIKNLVKRGFVFDGYNKNLKKSEQISLGYPTNPNVLIVMKGFSESKYAQDDGLYGSTIYDYAHFNPKLLTIAKSNVLQLEDLYVFGRVEAKTQKFLSLFNTEMNKYNYSYSDNAVLAHVWGDSQFAYSKDSLKKTNYICRLYQREDTIVIRLFLKNINSFSEYIENTPEYIKKSFTDDHGKCRGCKSDCKTRKTYTLDGKTYSKCQGETLYFYNISLQAIPYYMDLINLSHSKGKCTTEM